MYDVRAKLKEGGLKITPQRVAVLEALFSVAGHPSADMITETVRANHPNISVGTIYQTLETLTRKGLIKKVKTGQDKMRYDVILDAHHHLYCSESDRIEDYFDDEITRLLEDHFKKKKIRNFHVEEIRLQIIGKFSVRKTGLSKPL